MIELIRLIIDQICPKDLTYAVKSSNTCFDLDFGLHSMILKSLRIKMISSVLLSKHFIIGDSCYGKIKMSLKARIGEDIKLAMKAKDKIRLQTIRSIKKAILDKEVELRPKGQDSLTEEQEIELLSQQAKQRRDSIEQFQNAGRDDLATQESQELAIIETYLPEQVSDRELEAIIDEIIVNSGATSVKDLGKVMSPAMKQLKGKADGKKIQALVRSKLA